MEKCNYVKIFIKFSRLLGYELLDQNTFESPTLNKNLEESLSIAGKGIGAVTGLFKKVEDPEIEKQKKELLQIIVIN